MKTKIVCFAMGGVMLGLVSSAGATLWDNSTDASLMSGVVYDDVADQYWIQDLSMFVNQNYSTQVSNISTLNAAGSSWLNNDWNDWHMASSTDMNNLLTYGAESIVDDYFFPSFIVTASSYTAYHLEGRLSDISGSGQHSVVDVNKYDDNSAGISYNIFNLTTSDSSYNLWTGAWVVADATQGAGGGSGTAPVPEPATMFLFSTGLAGLAGYRARKKKK